MSRIKKITQEVLPLKIFIRKAQVVDVYRALLRSTRHIDDSFVQVDLRKQIVSGFKDNKNLQGEANIAQAIREANGHLSMLKDMGKKRENAKDSWINNSVEDDERGRPGSGWPWGA
jgi:hypothetical protein